MSPGKPNRKRVFTPSDDALIREQPVTCLGLKTLETMLRTSRETPLRRADELGVSLAVSEHDEAVDTRVLRCNRWSRGPATGTAEASAWRRAEVTRVKRSDQSAQQYSDDVRFTPKSEHVRCKGGCPLWGKSGHVQATRPCRLGPIADIGAPSRLPAMTFAILDRLS